MCPSRWAIPAPPEVRIHVETEGAFGAAADQAPRRPKPTRDGVDRRLVFLRLREPHGPVVGIVCNPFAAIPNARAIVDGIGAEVLARLRRAIGDKRRLTIIGFEVEPGLRRREVGGDGPEFGRPIDLPNRAGQADVDRLIVVAVRPGMSFRSTTCPARTQANSPRYPWPTGTSSTPSGCLPRGNEEPGSGSRNSGTRLRKDRDITDRRRHRQVVRQPGGQGIAAATFGRAAVVAGPVRATSAHDCHARHQEHSQPMMIQPPCQGATQTVCAVVGTGAVVIGFSTTRSSASSEDWT